MEETLTLENIQTPEDGAKWAMEQKPGRIIEIGGGSGENCLKFLKVAHAHGKKVLVIDPWESGWDEMPKSYRYTKESFDKTVEKYVESLEIHKATSLCISSDEACKGDITFAYVDGLQWKGAVLSDLRIVAHAFMICVDDNTHPNVSAAIEDFIKQTGRKLITKERYSFIL